MPSSMTTDPQQVASAARQSTQLADELRATTHHDTPIINVPFVPEIGTFLAELSRARNQHLTAVQRLAQFYSHSAESLRQFHSTVAAQDDNAASAFYNTNTGDNVAIRGN